jgi:hypothetical protein
MQVSGHIDAVTLFKSGATEFVFSIELEIRLAPDAAQIFYLSWNFKPGYPIFQSVVYRVGKSEVQRSLW